MYAYILHDRLICQRVVTSRGERGFLLSCIALIGSIRLFNSGILVLTSSRGILYEAKAFFLFHRIWDQWSLYMVIYRINSRDSCEIGALKGERLWCRAGRQEFVCIGSFIYSIMNAYVIHKQLCTTFIRCELFIRSDIPYSLSHLCIGIEVHALFIY